MVNKIYNNSIPSDYGKIPPQSIELEESVLGAILLEKDALIDVIDFLKPESFYKDEHQKIYQSILNLFKNNKGIDCLTVTEQLRKDKYLEECGGPAYITQIQMRISSASHIEYHARIVHQKYMQRELIRISSEVMNRSFDESLDVKDIIDFAETEIFNINNNNIQKEAVGVSTILNNEIKIIHKLVSKEITFNGIPSGYTSLDRLTGGFQKSDLILVAARPSMGKTAIILHMAKNIASYKKKVMFFSLEMSKEQLIRRLISYETGIDTMDMSKGNLTENELLMLEILLEKYNIDYLYIDDTPSLSITEFKARIKRYKMKYGVDIAIVDYLQLMKGEKTSGNREQEISSISSGLKSCAKINDIPIIALSQLSRELEKRANKRPMLSDLRESGSLEQDADMVIFIHRPEKFGEETISTDKGEIRTKGLIDLIIAKYRNGSQGDVLFWSNDSFTRFREQEEDIPEIQDNSDLKPTNKFTEEKPF